MKKFFSNLCDNLIDLYDFMSRQSKKSDRYAEKISNTNKKINSWFFRIPILGGIFKFLYAISPSSHINKNSANELCQELGYETPEPKNPEMPNRASKCYLVLFFPLVIATAISMISALFSFVFTGNTILFFSEYVKLLPLILLFFLLFLVITPYLFFKLFFTKDRKNIQIYTYGALVAIILPTLIIPQDYHHYFGKPLEIIGTVKSVYKNDHRQKRNYIVFLTNEENLNKMKLTHLSRHLTDNAKVGEKYMIKGRKSKFYFTYDSITKKSKYINFHEAFRQYFHCMQTLSHGGLENPPYDNDDTLNY